MKNYWKFGLAWHYKRYDNNHEWHNIETNAKAAKNGLWSQATAIPPWDYLRLKH
jgi:micrococcal nuclease